LRKSITSYVNYYGACLCNELQLTKYITFELW